MTEPVYFDVVVCVNRDMNVFEDLVADLQKENLLDAGIVGGHGSFASNSANPETAPNYFFKEVLTFGDNTKVAPEVSSEIQPDKSSNKNPQSFIPNVTETLSANETQKRLRKVQIKTKKKGRYCKTCLIGVPHYRLRCKFCGEKIPGSYLYYFLVLFALIAGLVIFSLIIISKNYS